MKGRSANPGNAFVQYATFVVVLALFLVASLLILAQGVAPTILSLTPASINAGNSGFTLTVNGTGFSSLSSSLQWNGSPQPTTFVSSTQVTGAIPGSLLTFAGINGVTVVRNFQRRFIRRVPNHFLTEPSVSHGRRSGIHSAC